MLSVLIKTLQLELFQPRVFRCLFAGTMGLAFQLDLSVNQKCSPVIVRLFKLYSFISYGGRCETYSNFVC